MMKTVTTIYMKKMKVTMMMVPNMIISDLKIIQNTLLFLTMLRIFSAAVYQIFYYD